MTYEATLPATLLQELPRRAPPAWTPPPPDGGPAHAMSVRTAIALEVLKTRLAGMSHVPCENLPVDSLARFAYRMADAAIAAQGGCGSKRIAVHTLPCSELNKHPFD